MRGHEGLVVEQGGHARRRLEHLARRCQQRRRRAGVQAHHQQRVGHLVAAVGLQQQEGQRVGAVRRRPAAGRRRRCSGASGSWCPGGRGWVPIWETGGVPRRRAGSRASGREPRGAARRWLGALVELQGEAAHQFRRSRPVDAPAVKSASSSGQQYWSSRPMALPSMVQWKTMCSSQTDWRACQNVRAGAPGPGGGCRPLAASSAARAASPPAAARSASGSHRCGQPVRRRRPRRPAR